MGAQTGRKRRKNPAERRPDMVEFYGVNTLDEINRARRVLGISEIIPKERRCLKCDVSFLSEDFGNRMCGQCRNLRE